MNRQPAQGTGSKSTLNKGVVALSAGLLLSLIAVVVLIVHIATWSSHEEQYVLRSAEQRVVSQAIAKSALSAAAGDASVFPQLQESRQAFQKLFSELKNGMPETGLPPSPPGVNEELNVMEGAWLVLRQNADDIISSQESVVAIRSHVDTITETIPVLEDSLAELVDILVSNNARPQMIAVASEQRTLAERIDKNVTRVLEGGEVTVAAIDRFSRDVDRFSRVLEGMKKGSESLGIERIEVQGGSSKLEEIDKVFHKIEEQASGIIETVPTLLPALEAASQITESSDQVDKAATGLIAAYDKGPGRFSIAGIKAGPGLLAAVSAFGALCLLLIMYSLVQSSRRREAESIKQNERNQQAILRLLDEMGDLADGDLTVTATVTEDVTGAIADSINYAIEALRTLVTTINETAIHVSTSAQESRATAMHLAEASEHQAEQLVSATYSIKEMTGAMDQMSSDAAESSEISQRSVEIAAKGADTVRRTIQGMDTIREQIQETAKRIKRLGESSQEIGDIVELIDDIADQTNILALNAAMQAAMAGEAGRGFAVVADEVQRLAERSSNATKQIEALVKTIQADTNEAVSSMENTTTEVVSGARLSEDAGEALKEIENVSQHISERSSQVAESAQKQSASASRIDQTMSVIREITTQTSDGTSQTAASIGTLADLADQLQESVAGFRLPE